jgi:hypothetical protein
VENGVSIVINSVRVGSCFDQVLHDLHFLLGVEFSAIYVRRLRGGEQM